jgi:DNA-directed RNA polymerase subunit RPC12/RpoP
LTEAGSLFIDDLMDRKAIVDVSSLYQQDSALARSQVMFIRTEQSLWAVQFGDQDTAVLSLTIDEACELMVSLLIQKDEPTDRPASQITQAVSPAEAKTEVINCSKCGQTLAPAAKFCVHCGAPAPLPIAPKTAVFCKYCGAKLIPGKHFCAKCGNHAINNYLRSIIKRALEIIKGLIEQKNDERIWHWLSRKVVKKSADGYQRYLNR